MLLFANIFFPTIFGVLLFLLAYRKKDWSVLHVATEPEERNFFKFGTCANLTVWTGLANIMNGFLIVYGSPPDRTPPLVQAVLQNSGVIFSVPFSIYLLGDRKQYGKPEPLLAAALIAISVFVSILPTILQVF